MKVCPYCHHEYPEGNWNCPYCHKYVPTNLVGTGHATQGDFSKLEEDKQVSIEDQDIIRDDNHISSSAEDSDDVETAQPYSFVEHNNGDRD